MTEIRSQGANHKKAVWKGLIANAYGQAVTIVTQVLAFPLFLGEWSADRFGTWLLMTTVPTYLALADFGLSSAAGTQMTMLVVENKLDAARTVLHSVVLFLGLLSTGLIILTSIAVFGVTVFFPLPLEVQVAIIILVLSVVVAQYTGVGESVSRSVGFYPLSATISASFRLTEWMGWAAGLLLSGSFAAVAAGGLVMRLFGAAAMFVVLKRRAPYAWRAWNGSLKQIKKIMKPAFGTFYFSAGSAIALQGMSIVVASVFGPAPLVVFNAYRTATRLVVQLTGMVSNAVWPEFSRVYVKASKVQMWKLVRYWCARCGVLAAVTCSVGFIVFEFVLKFWTGGEVIYDVWLSGVFWLCAAAASAWNMPRTALMAVNAHTELGATTVIFSLLGLGAAYAAATSSQQIWSVVCCMLVVELSCLAAAVWWLQKVFNRIGPQDLARAAT